MTAPLMPKATAVWLVENTTLTFKQIGDFCELHELEVQAIADGFKRPGESKILIYAYNFNDGGNDFKNKRLSLNRAVEIRSYLMTRGYKNFGIKIVNTDNRGKQNTVEVFEQAD